MPRPQRDVEASLLRKGFQQSENDHHYFIYWQLDGKKSRFRTKTSHGHREISDDLLSQMSKQVGLVNRDFQGLLDCPLSREEYEVRATLRR